VHSVVGRESPRDRETYQVTEASSDSLHEIYDGLSALSQMTILDSIMPSTRKHRYEDNETIYIPERTAQYVFEGKQFAFDKLIFVSLKCVGNLVLLKVLF
jgi:hypothetical protein